MIVATAGHIDHGKTSLVKALTGTDTARLPEEKARGISIDLGFAYLPLPQGGLIGFVDVPGHERFVRNMLAGVCGIDYALLVVAADDGEMPQTLEHLNILRLLNVRRGAVVVTKVDTVSPERVAELSQRLQHLLTEAMGTPFPVLPVSARTGNGVAELRALLVAEAATVAAARGEASSGQHFRFAADRVFVVSGTGTVVTGTVFSGRVRADDKLTVSGSGAEVRIRGIQVHRSPVTEVAAGQRCALNISGGKSDSVRRGDWVLHPAIHNRSSRLDVRIALLPSESRPLVHWTSVHLHHGSAASTARIVLRGGASIAPGEEGYAQIVLDEEVCGLRLDRFILRDQSATRTIGGGVILDPLAVPLRRRDVMWQRRLGALGPAAPRDALLQLAELLENGVDLEWFERICNLSPERASALLGEDPLVRVGTSPRLVVSASRYAALCRGVLDALSEFHDAHPGEPGLKQEALRRLVAPALPPDAFHAVLKALAGLRRVEIEAATVRLPGRKPKSKLDDVSLWELAAPAIEAAEFMAPTVSQLALQLEMREDVLRNFLLRKAAGGHLLRVTSDRFYLRATVAQMAAIAQKLADASPIGSFTAADYRDASGAGRKAVIHVLEFFDAIGITRRLGDARRMGRDYIPVFGNAPEVAKENSRP